MRFFVARVQDKFVNVQAEQPLDETKLDIIAAIKAELKITEAKQVKEQAEVTPLAQFNSKGVFARKRVKGRNFSYEFCRLSKDVQNELDLAIAAILEKHQDR
ncbi:ParB family protein [Vibrio vulnificus]